MPIIDPELKEKIPAFLRNKFFLLFFGYFIYLLFFNQNNLISQVKLGLKLRELNQEVAYYNKEIIHINKEQKELFSSIDNMEKYAREHYWMKRDSEDLYIFMPPEEK
ncbi:MAG: septum formation initiator family protein [Chitinophagales bacterium]|nr:septum formation initiator family protein [Bacteroidota bacterium]